METIYLAGFVVFVFLVIGIIIARLYVRAPKDVAFVRTGLGGQKVVLDGGAVKLPVFHDITWVNLNTLRLEVNRTREGAMITLDRMRVDIGVEFYVRVKPNREAISLAAQTLGERTMHTDQLRELVEAKFVDALRGVAAQMTINDLHEKRPDFVHKVQQAVAADLEQNGLELESVSLTALDQTPAEFFNPQNTFDAEGLTRLTEITEAKRKERNDIEQEARITIEQRNLDADKRALEIKQEKETVELETIRNIANRAAETKAETAAREAEAERTKEEAAIQAQLAVRRKTIESDRDVELAEQEKAIAVANRSRDESQAEAEANEARAEAVRAEEKVKTVARVAEAERQKEVEVLVAQQDAEKQAVSVTVAAEAERQASEDRAEAELISARARSQAVKIEAQADAERYKVEAEGQEAINNARNVIDDRIIAYELKQALIKVMPEVMEQSMKPVEKIKDIRIIDMGGGNPLNGVTGGTGGNGHLPVGGNGESMPDAIVKSLLAYRLQAPLIDELLEELGFKAGESPNAMLGKISEALSEDRDKAKPAAKPGPVEKFASAPKAGLPDAKER